jgi:hypothetical protein
MRTSVFMKRGRDFRSGLFAVSGVRVVHAGDGDEPEENKGEGDHDGGFTRS